MLESYEAANGVSPKKPLPLETFVDYGKWFQRHLVPDLDIRAVATVERFNGGFNTVLVGGLPIHSNRVVVAAGIGPFQRIPEVLRSLPTDLVSHCYSGVDVPGFSGKCWLLEPDRALWSVRPC